MPPARHTVDPAEELAQLIDEGEAQLTDSFDDRSSSPSPVASALQSGRTNSVLRARRLASRYNLGPYARELEEFTTESAQNRDLILFAKLVAVENKISNLNTAAGAYVVSKALSDNIKSYVLCVLLSPKLSTYKGDTPAKRVLGVLKHLNTNVPSNMETDRHVNKAVREAVKNELTQARSQIKKAVKASIESSQSVYELACGLVNNTECTVTVELCARLALLRKVYSEPGNSDQKYWDNVNTRLELIREVGNGSNEKIRHVFSGLLARDREAYGTASSQLAQDTAATQWERTVDAILDAAPPPAPTDHIQVPSQTSPVDDN